MRLGCVLMAAGNAARFGANKLLVPVNGTPMIIHALNAIPQDSFNSLCVVTQYPDVAVLAVESGFSVVENLRPDLGISHTIQLGLDALGQVDAALFSVADQPHLCQNTVRSLVDFYLEAPEKIAAVSHQGHRGNPCLFPASFFPELRSLTGDHGGSFVIRSHPRDIRFMETDAAQLRDIDTPAQLSKLDF